MHNNKALTNNTKQFETQFVHANLCCRGNIINKQNFWNRSLPYMYIIIIYMYNDLFYGALELLHTVSIIAITMNKSTQYYVLLLWT